MRGKLYALGAIALWSTLATLGVALQHLPAFLLTGLALLIGSTLALPSVLRDPAVWRVSWSTLALGIYGLFGFHFLLFMALRHAPAVEANLVNYLWPLLMVVLAPVLLRGVGLQARHLVAAGLGFAGAGLAILGAGGEATSTVAPAAGDAGALLGYLAALGSAFIWASYSLLTQRVARFSTSAIGLFGLLSGLLSLACHALLEPAQTLAASDWLNLTVMGLGPLGAAFFLWDRALKTADVRQIGVLSYLTPLASTTLLMLSAHRALTWNIGLAAALIVGAALFGTRAGRG